METQNFHPTDSRTVLIVLEQGSISCYGLDAGIRWSLGREATGNTPDIPLKSPVASRHHGEFVLVDDEWFYFDRGSLNGTLYNGKKIKGGINGRINPIMLANGDVLRIDRSVTSQSDPRGVWMLFSTENIPGEWAYFSLLGRSVVIMGRDAERCGLVQPLPYVSAQHMKFTMREGKCWVADCGSKAGTWLNGRQIEDAVPLREKDWVSIGDCHFVFTGTGLIYNDCSSI